MAGVIIRKFKYRSDFAAVADFVMATARATFPDYHEPKNYRRLISTELRMINQAKRSWLRVASYQGAVVGLIWVDLRGPGYLGRKIGFIHYLYVLPEYRRHGLATRLKKQAEKYCRSRGCHAVEGVVAKANKMMVRLNHKLGYKIDRYVFSKNL